MRLAGSGLLNDSEETDADLCFRAPLGVTAAPQTLPSDLMKESPSQGGGILSVFHSDLVGV